MFNKETEYALRSLVYIQYCNYKDHNPGIAEIAKEIGAPPFYIAKILQRLVKIGFIHSIRGKRGGFYFETSQTDLPLKNIIEATEGQALFTGCGFGLKECDEHDPCPVHDKFTAIRDGILKLVTEETVQSLASKVMVNNSPFKR